MVFKGADWLDIKLDILFRYFFFFLSLQLFCDYSCSDVWELDSAPAFQCVSVFGKNVFNLLKSFFFSLMFMEVLLGVWNKEISLPNVFLLQMITFCFGFQMEPLSVDISGRIPPRKPCRMLRILQQMS